MKNSNETKLPIELGVGGKLVHLIKERLKSILNVFLYWKLKKINSLYMAHKDEECYLFGDGVSIKWMDLNKKNQQTNKLIS